MITLLLAGALACTPPSEGALVGFWETTTTSRGGIGQSIELKASGEMTSATTIMVEQAYRTAGDKMFVADSAKALDTPAGEATFKVVNGVLVQDDGQGGEIRKERLGPPPPEGGPLIGAWRYRHYTGAIAFERYTADGRFLFRLPMTSEPGCYDAAGGTFTADVAGRKSPMQYSVAGTTLTLQSPDGKSYTYRRAEPWYPRDRIDYRPPTGSVK